MSRALFEDMFWEGSDVLKNKLDIHDSKKLAKVEREISTLRSNNIPQPKDGIYNFEHLKEVHKHLFGDVYDWAGQERQFNMSKDDHQFCLVKDFPKQIESFNQAMKDLKSAKTRNDIVEKYTDAFSIANHIHPFREGNGRATRDFFDQATKDKNLHLKIPDNLTKQYWNDACFLASSTLSEAQPQKQFLRDVFEKSLKETRTHTHTKKDLSIEVNEMNKNTYNKTKSNTRKR